MGNHRPARLRATSFLGLAILLHFTTAHSQDVSPCIRTWNSYLSNIADCGDVGSIEYCFSTVPDRVVSDQIRECFVSAGCTAAEASIEAGWTMKKCDEIILSERGQWHKPTRRGHLEALNAIPIRAAPPPASSPHPAPISAAKPAPEKAETSTTSTTSETSKSAQSTESSTPHSSGSSPPTPSTTSTSSSESAATETSTTSRARLVCSSKIQVSTTLCPLQSTGTAEGQPLSCYPTTVASASCLPGLLCMENADGDDTCMVIRGLESTGVVILITMGSAALVGTLGVCFAWQRERRRQLLLQDQWEITQMKRKVAAAKLKGSPRRKLIRQGGRTASAVVKR